MTERCPEGLDVAWAPPWAHQLGCPFHRPELQPAPEPLYPAHASLCPAGLPDCWDCDPKAFEPKPGVDPTSRASPSGTAPDACSHDPVAIRNAALEEAANAVERFNLPGPARSRLWVLLGAATAIRALKTEVPR